jgi:hypothetical protein
MSDKKYYEANKEKLIDYQKKYYKANKESLVEYGKDYYVNNRDKKQSYLAENKAKIAAKKKLYYEANKAKLIKLQSDWSIANKDKTRIYQKKRLAEDVVYRLRVNVKNLIGNSLRNNNFKKTSRTEQILGCSFEEFKILLESKFESWMNWDNRGLYNGELNFGWDIDHIIPLSSATCEADIIKLNHYTNLQPLCSYTNRKIKRDF